jgi:hypothetical protein
VCALFVVSGAEMTTRSAHKTAVLCVDVGSTFTKAVLVDLGTGDVLAAASHRTTLPAPLPGGTPAGDVLQGVDAVRAAAEEQAGVRAGDVLACSSAGGGLRIAVVGYERLVTAEAGRRVALSAGGRVVHVTAGPLTAPDVDRLRAARPDVVLLAGGTDGGSGSPGCPRPSSSPATPRPRSRPARSWNGAAARSWSRRTCSPGSARSSRPAPGPPSASSSCGT